MAQVFQSLFNSPYASGYQGAANTAGGGYNTVGTQALNNSTALSGALGPALTGAQSVLNTAFDPQQALYSQLLQKTNDQTNVNNAQYGLTGQQAAGNVNQADTNFNIDWQNNELARQLQGLSSYDQTLGSVGNAADAAGKIGTSGAGSILAGGQTPYGANSTIGAGQTSALDQYIQQLLGPVTSSASTIGQQQNYLNTGVNASNDAASQALANYQAQLSAQSNLGSGIGGLLGLGTDGSTIGGSLFSGIGDLFSGGAAAGGDAGLMDAMDLAMLA